MYFNILSVAAIAAIANAAALPEHDTKSSSTPSITIEGINMDASNVTAGVERYLAQLPDAQADTDQGQTDVKKRQATASFLNAALGGDAGIILGKALGTILNQLFPIGSWTPAREKFTQATTAALWDNNPKPDVWAGAVCYNKGWHVSDRSKISDVKSMQLKLGQLHTDYDCMYIGRNVQFYTDSEGGSINLSYRYDGNICSFDQSTGDLSCK